MIALDTETTGVDLHHDARPFAVTICDEQMNQTWYEWDVDPFTRNVSVPQRDLDLIFDRVLYASGIVGHNIRFDVRALRTVDARHAEWDWGKTDDTIVAAHVVQSNQYKDLTSLVSRYVDEDLQELESALSDAVQKARGITRRKTFIEEHGQYLTAKEGIEGLPSVKGSEHWRNDYWLPKCMYDRFDWIREEYPTWGTVLRDYSEADSASTMALWMVLRDRLKKTNRYKHYSFRRKTLEPITQVEDWGLTVNLEAMRKLERKYAERAKENQATCVSIAKTFGYSLTLPKSGVNNSLRDFVFGKLKVPQHTSKKSKTGAPSLDKDALAIYADLYEPDTNRGQFFRALAKSRKQLTSLSYMEGYRRFMKRLPGKGFAILYPSINPVGTTVTRRSSSHPNEQNISKQKDEDGSSLREIFGPAPGRVWYTMDYENLELRIPAYKYNERKMIALFERPDDAPYYGSYHLLVAHILWPDLFNKCIGKDGKIDGRLFKDRYKDTYYQWVKNGNFANQYGAIPESGTADRAYHQPGAQLKVRRELSAIEEGNQAAIRFANKHGYIETMPVRWIDRNHGYPVAVEYTWRGTVKPTTPLSYIVQGTAGECTERALQRVYKQLQQWNDETEPNRYRVIAEVHDELVYDFPKDDPYNHVKANVLKELMELSGDDIGIPLKVDVSFHPRSWAVSEEDK